MPRDYRPRPCYLCGNPMGAAVKGWVINRRPAHPACRILEALVIGGVAHEVHRGRRNMRKTA